MTWAPLLELIELDYKRLYTTDHPKLNIVPQLFPSEVLWLMILYMGSLCNKVRALCKFASHFDILSQPGEQNSV